MASNLSALISDAFTIYSEAYAKIGANGVRIVDLDKKPAQPKLWFELVYATRLFRVISPLLTLNNAGDAIVGVSGDIQTMNNLLLKLKRSVKLYNVPAFPTPLTNISIDYGVFDNASFVTVDSETDLIQSRKILAGVGISLADSGAQGNLTISSLNSLESDQVDTSSSFALDMNNAIERLFYGSVAIGGTRTWSISNAGNAKRFGFQFSISGLTPGASTHDQTLPANVKVADARIVSVGPPQVWRPFDNGDYEATATRYDGTNWRMIIDGPF